MKKQLQTIAKYDGRQIEAPAYLTYLPAIHRIACNVIEQLAVMLAKTPNDNKIRFAIKRIEAACTRRPVNGEYVELVDTVAYGIDLIQPKNQKITKMNQQQLKEGDVILAKFNYLGHMLPISGTIEYIGDDNTLSIVNDGGATPLDNIILEDIQLCKFKIGNFVRIKHLEGVKRGTITSIVSFSVYDVLCDNGAIYRLSDSCIELIIK